MWPRFLAQVLEPLAAGRAAHYQVRDWVGDEFGSSLNGWKTMPWCPVVLVEGVTCTRRAARPCLSCSIWVEALEATRLRRGMERDGEDPLPQWERWIAEERRFFAAAGTSARADLRVDGYPSVTHDPETHVVLRRRRRPTALP